MNQYQRFYHNITRNYAELPGYYLSITCPVEILSRKYKGVFDIEDVRYVLSGVEMDDHQSIETRYVINENNYFRPLQRGNEICWTILCDEYAISIFFDVNAVWHAIGTYFCKRDDEQKN